MRLLRTLWILGLLGSLPSCAASIPRRYVLERNVEGWSYRRYQRVLDVEIPVEGNPAVGHTATYVERSRRRSTAVPFANVFVAVYDHAHALGEEVRRRLQALASYDVSVRALGGGYVWYLDGGPGDRWALWVSGRYVVKVGAGEALDDVPGAIVSAYMDIYPSDLDDHGRSRAGTASAGEPAAQQGPSSEGSDELPHYLRGDAPR